MWFRCILFYLFAVTVVVVPCLADDFNKFTCPNDMCSELENVDLFRSSDHSFQPPERLRCCKLSKLQNGHTVQYSNVLNYYHGQRKEVGLLIIENSPIDNFPLGLMIEIDPVILRIVHSDLVNLKISDFTGATHLTELNVTYSKIENLEPNIFILAPNIEVIDLSDNRIAEVSEYTFENIPKLRILILSNNLIKKFDFKSSPINLEVFMIGNNSLTYLNENLLARSTRLAELCINDNKLNISKLNVAVVGGVLEVFDMSNNPTSIDLNSKNLKIKNSNVKVLHIDIKSVRIDASENQIYSIVVDQRNNLIELNLSRNNYTTIRNLTELKSIEKLDLSFNRIEDFSLTTFFNMTHLRELNLENSGLQIIDFGFFSQQTHLSWLDISYNNLKEINFNMLPGSINHLYIEGNDLSNIDLSDNKITLPHLQRLGLSNNKFSCEKLIEIRKLLTTLSVEMYVDELLMVKFSRNINGIACLNENSTETMEFSSNKLLPIHTDRSDPNQWIDTIQLKIKEIETNIRQHNDSLTQNSIDSKDDILSMKQELMNIRSDGDLKIIEAKADILMSVSRLFNLSMNGSDVSVDLKSTVEEINQINLERFQTLSLQLKLVKDKLQDVVQSVTNLNRVETNDEKNVLHLKQNRDDDRSSVDLISLKNMLTFIVVIIICLIFGFSLILFYKRCYNGKRRYTSTNTVNTNVEQSLV